MRDGGGGIYHGFAAQTMREERTTAEKKSFCLFDTVVGCYTAGRRQCIRDRPSCQFRF